MFSPRGDISQFAIRYFLLTFVIEVARPIGPVAMAAPAWHQIVAQHRDVVVAAELPDDLRGIERLAHAAQAAGERDHRRTPAVEAQVRMTPARAQALLARPARARIVQHFEPPRIPRRSPARSRRRAAELPGTRRAGRARHAPAGAWHRLSWGRSGCAARGPDTRNQRRPAARVQPRDLVAALYHRRKNCRNPHGTCRRRRERNAGSTSPAMPSPGLRSPPSLRSAGSLHPGYFRRRRDSRRAFAFTRVR